MLGARGTGKSTLLRSIIPKENTLWIDLLRPEEEDFYAIRPEGLSERLDEMSDAPQWVVIDEVQKSPKLLDVVHHEIENRKIKFALTGSSARKLKRGGANLLAGRAFVNHLYPLTFIEIGERFNLLDALSWGTLPAVVNYSEEAQRHAFLNSYVNTYLKEEIVQEQLVRHVVPFRKFLPIASQLSGTILNYNSIANDLGVDWSTVKNYFEILEDTLLGFEIPAYSRSLRKQQLKSSRFYIFDVGVKRALDRTLSLKPTTGQLIGPLFEHLVISEIYRLNEYCKTDFTLAYLATQAGLEIDLVVDRPGAKPALVEIKSAERVTDKHLRHLHAVANEFPEYEAFCLCREKVARKVARVHVLPWDQGILELGLVPPARDRRLPS